MDRLYTPPEPPSLVFYPNRLIDGYRNFDVAFEPFVPDQPGKLDIRCSHLHLLPQQRNGIANGRIYRCFHFNLMPCSRFEVPDFHAEPFDGFGIFGPKLLILIYGQLQRFGIKSMVAESIRIRFTSESRGVLFMRKRSRSSLRHIVLRCCNPRMPQSSSTVARSMLSSLLIRY